MSKAVGEVALQAIAEQDAIEKNALSARVTCAEASAGTATCCATCAISIAENAMCCINCFSCTIDMLNCAVDTLNCAINNINCSLTNLSCNISIIVGSDAGCSMRQVAEDVVNAS